jgi:hypothetical protein
MKKLFSVFCALASIAAYAFDGVNQAREGENNSELDVNGYSVVGVNLFSPVQLPASDRDIYGLRLNLGYGENPRVYGLDFGLFGLARGSVAGVQLQAFNWNEGVVDGLQVGALASVDMQGFTGIQVAGVCNVDYGQTIGFQVGGLFNRNEIFNGVQVAGIVNKCNDTSKGLQFAFLNYNSGEWCGASFGALNYVGKFSGLQLGVFNFIQYQGTGVQIGLFNAAQQLTGMQIGFLNMICIGYTPLLPFVNFSF